MRAGRGCTRDERGVSAIEFSIVAPALLFLVFSIIQAALYFHGRNVVEASAREGVSYLRLAGNNSDPGSFTSAAERASKVYASRLGSVHQVDAIGSIDTETGRVTMTVTGQIVLPLGGTWDVRQSVAATLEQFRGDPRGRAP